MVITPLNVNVTLHMTCVTAADRYSHLLPSLQRKGQAAQTLSPTSQRMYTRREDKFQDTFQIPQYDGVEMIDYNFS